MKIQNIKMRFAILMAAVLFSALASTAQTTVFTYQGKFTDSAVAQPTNGTYNMQFAMFDAVSGGNQIGVAVVVPAVQVVNGIFTVSLDYTAASFDGSPRFLQVTVGNTVLSPRQEITSAPLAIAARKALTALDSSKLGGIDADQYVTGQVVRSVNNLTNNVTLAAGPNITITPTGNTLTIASTGGAAGINNQTNVQTSANFNIDGTGTAKIFNAGGQFNLGGNRFLGGRGSNIFVGLSAGAINTTGGDNTFVGTRAGLTNTTGTNNSFFGTDAGRSNTADDNSFFGRSAGFDTAGGSSNSFFGLDSGRFNVAGSNNAFYGRLSGANSKADDNSFVGFQSGGTTTTGGSNSFFGYNAGLNNTSGANNTSIGSNTNFGAGNLSFATAIGSGSVVSTSNTIVLGRSDGSDTVRIFGLGAAGSTSLCRNDSNQISTCAAGAGSADYIQNQNNVVQSADFNIGGSGVIAGFLSAGSVNTSTNYKIGNQIILSTPNATSVVVGQSANFNVAGNNSALFGYEAGKVTTGSGNAFFGSMAGALNSSGANNTFIGGAAGSANTVGFDNTFVGSNAGDGNNGGSKNSIVGSAAFVAGSNNTSVGHNTTTIGSNNTVIGFQAIINGSAAHSTVIGADAFTNKSNTVVLGTINDTVEAPNLITAKNIMVSSKVTAFTVASGLGSFDAIKLSSPPLGDKPLCLKNGTNEIGVCPTDLTSQNEQGADVLFAAVKAQKAQIEKQAEQIKEQQSVIEALKQTVCATNPAAKLCRQ
jgi:hypothetical protein